MRGFLQRMEGKKSVRHGQTIKEHVNIDPARLAGKPSTRKPNKSSYRSIEEAERAAAEVIAENREEISEWLNNPNRELELVLEIEDLNWDGGTGYGYRKGSLDE